MQRKSKIGVSPSASTVRRARAKHLAPLERHAIEAVRVRVLGPYTNSQLQRGYYFGITCPLCEWRKSEFQILRGHLEGECDFNAIRSSAQGHLVEVHRVTARKVELIPINR